MKSIKKIIVEVQNSTGFRIKEYTAEELCWKVYFDIEEKLFSLYKEGTYKVSVEGETLTVWSCWNSETHGLALLLKNWLKLTA